MFSITGGAATAAADMPLAMSKAARTRVYLKIGSLSDESDFFLLALEPIVRERVAFATCAATAQKKAAWFKAAKVQQGEGES
ncbi:hypothetical protein [Achromobacter sp. AGC39]